MSAIPTPGTLVEREALGRAAAEPVRIAVPAGLARAARTIALLGRALFVPGEAERISARIAPRGRR